MRRGAAAAAERRRAEAIDDLRQATEALTLQEGDDETLATRLSEWIKAYDDTAPERQRAVEEWSNLRNLLGEGTIDDLENATERTRKAAETAAQDLDEQAVSAVILEGDNNAQLRELRRRESECKEKLSAERGGLEEVARNLPGVAEAEEEVERAEAEHERITNLSDILSKNQRFLEHAQDEVHRDIAPHLVKAPDSMGQRCYRGPVLQRGG